jgi:hypothetical protein
MRYCKEIEVNTKRQKAILQKSGFLAKLRLLKSLGRKDQLMLDTEIFLEQNIDELYKQQQAKHREARRAAADPNAPVPTVDLAQIGTKLRAGVNTYYEKKKLKEQLLAQVETSLKAKIRRKRQSSIKEIRERTDKKREYRQKVVFIENNLKKDIQYF